MRLVNRLATGPQENSSSIKLQADFRVKPSAERNHCVRSDGRRPKRRKNLPRGMTTVQRHILEQERAHPGSSGELTSLLWDLTIAAKIISHQVNRGGLGDIFGETGEE